MGLAASQARYLSLTARKTNVEYEGQQVNQERTALANQSAALYNQMLALDVPTPPSKTDYTKTVYTYTDPSTSNTVSIDLEQIYKNPVDGSGTQTYTISGYTSISSYISNISSIVANGSGVNGYTIAKNNNGKYTISVGGGTSMTLSGPVQFRGLTQHFIDAEEASGNTDTDTYPSEDDYYFTYTNAQTGIQYFIKADDGEDTLDNLFDKYNSGETNFSIYSAEAYTDSEYFHVDDAIMTIASDGTGRYNTISYYTADQYETDSETGVKTLKENAQRTLCKLTQTTVSDDDAYDDAMETYEAKKAIYDQTVSEINAKTEIIQQQDKTLELHLDQLDTEQQAIQTEMEAIKKVIDKNIEETFKIFA